MINNRSLFIGYGWSWAITVFTHPRHNELQYNNRHTETGPNKPVFLFWEMIDFFSASTNPIKEFTSLPVWVLLWIGQCSNYFLVWTSGNFQLVMTSWRIFDEAALGHKLIHFYSLKEICFFSGPTSWQLRL